MMFAEHAIAEFEFYRWIGDDPPHPSQPMISTHTRPGVDGVYQVQLGNHGQTFEAELWAIHATFAAAQAFSQFYASLVGRGPVPIKQNNVFYLPAFGMLYSVDRILSTRVDLVAQALGPWYSYAAGGRVKVRLQMTSHPVALVL